jgi:hypothetical protein
VNLSSTFGEFIFNPIDRRDKSFLLTPFQEPEAAGIDPEIEEDEPVDDRQLPAVR